MKTKPTQDELRRFVDQHIVCCVSSLIDDLAKCDDPNLREEVAKLYRVNPDEEDYVEAARSEDVAIVRHPDQAHPALKPEHKPGLYWVDMDNLITNHYRCPQCKYEWEDQWDCEVEDDCPDCGKRHITPYKSDYPEPNGPFDDIQDLVEDLEDNGIWLDPEPTGEVYEHWVVSSWLAEKLEAHGETVAEFHGLIIWARQTTGQAIILDYVIEQIWKELHHEPEDE